MVSVKFVRAMAPFTLSLLMAADFIFLGISFYVSKQNSFKEILFILLAAFPYIMIAYSFYNFFHGDPGSVAEALKDDALLGGITEEERELLPQCSICNLPKPPRAFHCKACGKCYLKLNIHIPFFGICVAVKNQRPFIVMIKWCAVSQFVNALVIIGLMIWSEMDVIFGSAFVIAYIALGILFEIFWDEEMLLVKKNITHAERRKRKHTQKYDEGKEQNIISVFGDDFFRYYIPSRSNMTGFEWMYKNNNDNNNEEEEINDCL